MKCILSNLRAKAFQHILFKWGWCDDWRQYLLISLTRSGIEWNHKGDDVIWLWPWRRGKIKGKPFVSTIWSGTAEWGDARYVSLAAMDKEWELCNKACENVIDDFVKRQEETILNVFVEAYTSKISTQ